MSTFNSEFEAEILKLFEQALNTPASTRRDWIIEQTQTKPALRARVLALLSNDEDGGGNIHTGAGSSAGDIDNAPPDKIGDYKIEDLIGKGGMGAVYLARRDSGDFDHTVAIKLIRTGILSDKVKDRFAQEQQVLASFNHPHIARLYDGGTLEDGSPYIIMEMIDGAAITQWADEKDLSGPARISLFLDACSAVSYAHQNLIIHRDLTPNNVLVDNTGQVKLIDFGIAKPYDEQAASELGTHSLASLSFTPGFAAPERSKGAAANTLSDIYSLGKLLEALCASSQNDPDCHAIIAKATATQPADRYASVDALSQDIQNWRGGFPVAARRGGTSYRLSKFLGRHKTGAAFSALALTGLIAALLITSVLYRQAETARFEADARFEEVRELANFMMFDLYDELETVQGNTKSLQKISQKSLSYLDALKHDKRASLDLKLEAALGYKRLADIYGNPIMANLGERTRTGPMLREAFAELETLAADNPGHDDVTRALAEVGYSLAVYEYVSEDNNALAHTYAAQSAEIYKSLSEKPGADIDDRRQFIRAKMMSGVPLMWTGRQDEGLAILSDAHALVKRASGEHPDNPDLVALNGSISVEMARALIRADENIDTAQYSIGSYWDDAVAIRERQIAAAPDNDILKRSLAIIIYERGAYRTSEGNLEPGLADINRGIEIGTRLLAKDENDNKIKRILPGMRFEKAWTLSRLKRFDEAYPILDSSLLEKKRLYERSNNNHGLLRTLAFYQTMSADVFLQGGRTQKGCGLLRDADASWAKLNEDGGLSEYDRTGAFKDQFDLKAKYKTECGGE